MYLQSSFIQMIPLAAADQQFDCDSVTLQQGTTASVPGPGRNGTPLLELRRRHVARRLDELQITLGRIKQRRRCDGETRSCRQRDSSSTPQGAGPTDGGGCSPAGGLWQDGSPGRQSPGQKTITSLSESHISGPRSCSSHARSDGPAGQKQLRVDGSGQRGSHSQVAMENPGH